MIEKLVSKIISKQLEENTISTEDMNIYRYGYMLVCEVFVNIIVAAIIAGISGEWLLVTLFLVVYIPLRSFCGGWHADKFWKCTIYSNLIIVIMIISKEIIVDMNNILLLFGAFIICSICIFSLAPVDTATKPIMDDEKKIYSKKIRIIMLIHSVIYIMMAVKGCNEIVYLLTFSYLTQVIMLMVGKICRKRRKNIEQQEEI